MNSLSLALLEAAQGGAIQVPRVAPPRDVVPPAEQMLSYAEAVWDCKLISAEGTEFRITGRFGAFKQTNFGYTDAVGVSAAIEIDQTGKLKGEISGHYWNTGKYRLSAIESATEGQIIREVFFEPYQDAASVKYVNRDFRQGKSRRIQLVGAGTCHWQQAPVGESQ